MSNSTWKAHNVFLLCLCAGCAGSGLVLLFLGRVQASGLAFFVAFGFLAFEGPIKGLSNKSIRELFSDDTTDQLDPNLVLGFVGALVGFGLLVNGNLATGTAALGAAGTYLGITKGTGYGIRKQINASKQVPKSVDEKKEGAG